MARQVHIIAIGACAIDTILTVPHFPSQDSKLRATALTKRRGGNSPNTLEVLKQLIQHESARLSAIRASLPPSAGTFAVPTLSLIATFPSRDSPNTKFIQSSFDFEPIATPVKTTNGDRELIITKDPGIDFSHCIYREEHSEPISSYIISDTATSSRTIVNYNPLPEMTTAECEEIFEAIFSSYSNLVNNTAEEHEFCFHFEGRIPDVTLHAMRYLRRRCRIESAWSLKISVEVEKPGREGLQELVDEADLVFYSRGWAEHQGYRSAEDCVLQQALRMTKLDTQASANGDCQPSRSSDVRQRTSKPTFVCTWGARGAGAVTQESALVCSSASQSPGETIIDTTGAGDTFIAGILFAFVSRDGGFSKSGIGKPQWSLQQKLDFANELAGRKILQNGFTRLGEAMKETVSRLDYAVEIIR